MIASRAAAARLLVGARLPSAAAWTCRPALPGRRRCRASSSTTATAADATPARDAAAAAAATAPAATAAMRAADPLPPDFSHPMDAEAFRRAGYAAIDYVADYYARLEASADADAAALNASSSADAQHVAGPGTNGNGGAPHAAAPAPAPALAPAPAPAPAPFPASARMPVTPPPASFPPNYLPPLLPTTAPELPESWDAVMRDYRALIEPGLTHWQHPSFFAYFPGATSYPGILSEVLIAATNTIGFSWAASPAATELERVAMDWLARLCGLPRRFWYFGGGEEEGDGGDGSAAAGGNSSAAAADTNAKDAPVAAAAASSSSSSTGTGGGMIQGTTSEAVLVAMLAARARAMRGRPPEDALRLVCYGSDQAHSCYLKATLVLGLPPGHARLLRGRQADAFGMRPSDLAEAVRADLENGLIPFFAMATIGTTSSCAVDPVAELSTAMKGAADAHVGDGNGGGGGNGNGDLPPPVWLHVDAAYAGAFAVLPEQRARHGFAGAWACADSYSYNPHKAGLVTFDCCAMWAADCGAVRDALALTPVFLRARANELDFKDLQVPLGRRFRALKLWAVLRCYGAASLRAHAAHMASMAAWLARRVEEDGRFELAAEPRFGLVCFRLRAPAAAAADADAAGTLAGGSGDGGPVKDAARRLNQRLLAAVNGSGSAFLIHTELEGLYTLRAAVGSLTQQPRHVEAMWRLVQAEAATVLAGEA